MRYAFASQHSDIEISNQLGAVYRILKGTQFGVCHVQIFVDEQRHVSLHRGFARLTWAFGALDRSQHVYLGVLHPYSLLPCRETLVRGSVGRFSSEATLRNIVLDTRDCQPFRFVHGYEIRSAHKYNDLTFQLRAEESHLAIRLRFFIGDQATGEQDAYMTVDYDIPYDRLLWRRAALVTDDDVSPESAKHVDIKRIGTLDDPGVAPGLHVSPVQYIPSELSH